MAETYVGKFRCETCGMQAETDDLSVIGRNCSATAFEKAHVMMPTDRESEQPAPIPVPDYDDYEEPPGPTLRERALAAQDRLGWAPMSLGPDGTTEFASGTVDLARVVTDLAREVERLTALIAAMQDGT